MELASQQAELLRILHEVGVPLSRDCFKPASELRWLSEPPPVLRSRWPVEGVTWPPKGMALEEPSTGYFFAADLGPKNVWELHMAPGPDQAYPTRSRVKDSYLAKFQEWAGHLAKELEALRATGGHLEVGKNALTLLQQQRVLEVASERGVNPERIAFEPSGGSSFRLAVKNTPAYFEMLGPWQGRFAPGQLTGEESFRAEDWPAVLTLVNLWLHYTLRELSAEFPAVPSDEGEVSTPSVPTLTLTSLRLKNIRKFQDLSIDFHPEVNLLCGRNGTGKSTLLRCLALALCHESDTAALLSDIPGDLVSNTEENGEIEVRAKDREGNEHTFTVALSRAHDRDVLSGQTKPDLGKEPFLCGYGSGFTLLSEHTPSDYTVREASASLFTYGARLFSLEVVLRRMRDKLPDSESYKAKLKKLSEAFGFGGIPVIKPGKGVYFVENGQPELPFEGLADGFRVSLSWLIDLYGWAMLDDAMAGDIPTGLLLCDEVDKHMHPELQAKLVGNLQRLLPQMQLFLTSHNPLTVLGCDPASVHILSEVGGRVVCESAPDFEGYSVEDVYTDPRLFSVEPFSPDIVKMLDEYRSLVQIPKTERTEEDTSRLRATAKKLQVLQVEMEPR